MRHTLYPEKINASIETQRLTSGSNESAGNVGFTSSKSAGTILVWSQAAGADSGETRGEAGAGQEGPGAAGEAAPRRGQGHVAGQAEVRARVNQPHGHVSVCVCVCVYVCVLGALTTKQVLVQGGQNFINVETNRRTCRVYGGVVDCRMEEMEMKKLAEEKRREKEEARLAR